MSTMTAHNGLPQVNGELRAGVDAVGIEKDREVPRGLPSSRPPARDAAHNAKQKPTNQVRIE